MPSEPLPWDRKDFFKERKHHNNHHNDRSSDSLIGGGGGSVARWRDYSSPHPARDFPRWGSVDFRRAAGHGKQGGYHMFAEDSGHGYVPLRSSDKMMEDESSRLSVLRGDGKYCSRSSRENRGSFGQRDCKGHSWETSNGSSNTSMRLHDVNSNRSVDDMLTYPSHPQSDIVSTWNHIQLKDQHDNTMGGVNGLGTGQRSERENSLDWKPLKWARSTSLSSRGSGYSHSSSSKSLGGIDSSDGKAELQPKSLTPVQSPSGDAAVYATSAAPSEETTSRKKPRLGWGEGLAKYEKKKVEGPDVTVSKDGAVDSPSNAEPFQSLSSTLAEKSPRVLSFSDCASPATPSSVACSSSPGLDDKAFGKAANVDNDVSNLCGSPSTGSQNHLEESVFNLEKLDTSSIFNLAPSLIELLQSDDHALADSSFVQSIAMKKLLVWKGDILKEIEVTESEIDSLDNELKSLKSASGSGCLFPTASSSLSEESNAKHYNEQDAVFDLTARPAPLIIESCGDAAAEEIPCCSNVMAEGNANAKDEDIDSPGTATSKFVEPLSLVKAVSPSDMVKDDEYSGELDATTQETNIEVKCRDPDSCCEEVTVVPICGNGGPFIVDKGGAPISGNFNFHADGYSMLFDIILGSNKESADKASEVFNKLLPSDQCCIDISGVTNGLCWKSGSLIEGKIAKRKQFLRFKERVLTLKFKAFQHLWKEDMRLLSARKCRARSQKKCELSLRSTHSGYQKHRSSIRTRFSSPASGNLSLVPTTEVINFTSKLLSESHVKVYRNPLKMPALILDTKEKMVSRFISSNGLVEDPFAAEKERSMINPWTSEEREIFLDKLATFGKDFTRIASFLDYKTTADCVEFYYKNHKSDCFQKMKKHDFNKLGKSSTNTYLVTSGKKWNRKMNAVSLDILGEASEMAAAAQVDNGRQLFPARISLRGRCDSKMSLRDDGTMEGSSSYNVFGSERETAAADVLAGICGSLSSEAMSSCITSSIDPGEGQREWKHQKLDSAVRHPSTSDVTQNVDYDTYSDESCGEMDPADWTDEEKSIFMQAFSTYGKDFSMISRCVRSRSRDQCKVFFSKARKCLGLDLIQTGCGNVGISGSDDANGGGGSDSEDVCALETSSVINSDKLDSKIEYLPSAVMNINQDDSDPARPMNLQTDLNKSEDDPVGPIADKKNELECLLSDAYETETRSEIVSCLESDKMNGADKQPDSVHTQKSDVLVDTECARDLVTKQGVSVVETKRVVGVSSAKGFGNGLDRQGLVLMDNNLNDKRDNKCNAHTSGESEMIQDSNTVGNSYGLDADTSSCSGFSFIPESLRASMRLDPVHKSPVISFPQESSLAAATSVARGSAAVIQLEESLIQDMLSSSLDLHEIKVKNALKSVGCNDYRQHLLENALMMNRVESSQILNGYPLQIPTKKEVNGDVRLSEVQSNLKSDRNVGGPFMPQDCYLQKCNSSIPHSSIAELALLSQGLEKASDQPRAHTEKPSRSGDVKLFGKILSHPSSSPKPNTSTHEIEEKLGHHHKQSSKASNIKFTALHPAHHGGTTHLMKFDRNNYRGLENVPVRSYGFWDGNRKQTGFSSLTDSAMLLAKYPAAFSNYPPSKMEQPLHSVVNGNEHNLNGVAVVPPREISSSNGVVDYHQVYRSRDCAKVQPFTVDMKQRQELYSEMQRRNGFEPRSSLQQPGRGLMAVNVIGRGGILVGGGPCTGIQDPVAALRQHYAKAEQYGGQSGGSMIREEESWRGKGDLGR
ncbi:hypothetical protein Ddye_028729 [Dipteronia dyeriana]|uniref:SANT domain-containing protein n=1 Tax=Dipteronia dyeriana TaxID=168575 RepID=A0AAD9TDA2_9ROSI|nr:hypothetical protein Ddye_028729 [Dipteronia dyeriana]